MPHRALFAVLALGFAACDSPLSPGECRDGRDSSGRGPTIGLLTSCFPSNSDLVCHSVRKESGYCAGPDRDVTTSTTWASSNTRVAEFDQGASGFLKVVGAGEVKISARFEGHNSNAVTFFVSPQSRPRQDTRVGIFIVKSGSARRTPIAGAEIDLAPSGAPSEHCVSNEAGLCSFIWRMDVAGFVDVSVSKPGYTPHQKQWSVPFQSMDIYVELEPTE